MSRAHGTYQLSHWLRSQGETCQVIDFCQWLTVDELVEMTLAVIGPDTEYVGISTTFFTEIVPDNVLKAQQRLLLEQPQIKWLVGGPRADSESYQALAGHRIVGKAEDQLSAMLGLDGDKFDIKTLAHRFSEFDCIQPGEILGIELGRGCIFRCRFCAHDNLGKPKYSYQRHQALVEEEMQYNFQQWGTTSYYYLDDTVNEDQDKVRWLSTLPEKTGIKDLAWVGYLRADLIARFPDSRDWLRQSGLVSPFFGIETLHAGAAKSIGKGWSGKEAAGFLPSLYEYWQREIPFTSNFIVGLPGETESDLRNTLAWALDNPMGSHKFVPLGLYARRTDSGPRSEFNDDSQKWGYIMINEPGSTWVSPTMDDRQARRLSQEFNGRLKSVNTLSGWLLYDYHNVEKDLDYLKKIKTSDSLAAETIQRRFRRGFLARYISAVKSLY